MPADGAPSATPVTWPRVGANGRLLLVVAGFAVVGGVCGTLPAALTWESVPHALRSIGTWPFVALFTGAVLSLAGGRRPWLPAVTAIVALVYTMFFLPAYASTYRRHEAPGYFHAEILDALAAGKAARPPLTAAESLVPMLGYGDEVLRYFVMHHDGLSCSAAAETMRSIRQRQH